MPTDPYTGTFYRNYIGPNVTTNVERGDLDEASEKTVDEIVALLDEEEREGLTLGRSVSDLSCFHLLDGTGRVWAIRGDRYGWNEGTKTTHRAAWRKAEDAEGLRAFPD